MNKSGYVLAAFKTMGVILDFFVRGKSGRYNNHFTRDQVAEFLSQTCAGFLHSYGQNFPNKKKYMKYNQTEAKLFHRCRSMGFFNKSEFIVDSGGFQISIGKLDRRESDLLCKMYYEFLEEYSDVYDRGFILDVPPGPGCKVFQNFDDVYKQNLDSYNTARSLPEEVRKKIIYVHHFRTPALWDIYSRILNEDGMFSSFEYHATGGIVANMSSDMSIPCIIYVLPLIPLVNKARACGRNYLNFHVLGGANFRDVLFYEFFKKTLKDKHDFNLEVTYDSTGPFKQVMNARFLYARDDNGYIRKMGIKENDLDKRFRKERTTEQQFETMLNDMAHKFNFKKINVDGVYDMYPNRSGILTKTFHADVKSYSILYSLYKYSIMQEEMKEFVERVYPIYDEGDLETFYKECFEMTRVINQGKLTKKQKIKAYSIPRSLDMLCTLDEDYCKYLVGKYLAKDEFTDLCDKSRVLTL